MNKSFFDSAAACLPDVCFKEPPRLGLVLGSGWDVSIDPDEVVARIDYADIPGLGATGVKGHAGDEANELCDTLAVEQSRLHSF